MSVLPIVHFSARYAVLYAVRFEVHLFPIEPYGLQWIATHLKFTNEQCSRIIHCPPPQSFTSSILHRLMPPHPSVTPSLPAPPNPATLGDPS